MKGYGEMTHMGCFTQQQQNLSLHTYFIHYTNTPHTCEFDKDDGSPRQEPPRRKTQFVQRPKTYDEQVVKRGYYG